MSRITLADREFEISIPFQKIDHAIGLIAESMNSDLKDKDPLMICILNGSFMFAADLMKKIDVPCQITFIKLASYEGTSTTGVVKELIGLNESIKGRNVVVLEDIVDTGITISNVIDQLKAMQPADIKIATLLFKPDACRKDLSLDYIGITIPNDFIVGYGLDYKGYGRNLSDIYTVIAS